MHFNDETVEHVAESIVTVTRSYLIPFGEFVLFKILFTYNECLALLQIMAWHLKQDCYVIVPLSNFVVNVVSFAAFCLKYIASYFLHSYMEPIYSNWICLVEMGRSIEGDMNSVFFVEQYEELCLHRQNQPEVSAHLLEKKCNQQMAIYVPESLVLMKLQDNYTVRMIHPTRSEPIVLNKNSLFKQSKVEFLSILYCHPTTLRFIEIKLPKGMYKVGNQLLSITHVWRSIMYSSLFSNQIPFDENYKLHIIDHNAMYFEITAGEFILLEEDNYKIMKQEK